MNSPSSVPLSRDAKALFRLFEGLRGGILEVALPDGSRHRFGEGGDTVLLEVHDEQCFERMLDKGDIGLAEAYMDGQWDSPDVSGLLALFASNRDSIRRAIYGAWHMLLAARIRHWLNRNTRRGSRRNIVAHYDLGNDFYRLWLDPSMTYSAALFEGSGRTLEQAQHAKYARVLDRLQARPGQRVLEIGCGWGGFAEMAVQGGLDLVGISLSPAQLEWARRRVPKAELRLQDYRDLREQFDHIVSIEMIEAVGERWWPDYFRTIAKSLRQGGRAVVQGILIRDDLFDSYRRGTDFIQQYIFPGGMLLSRKAVREQAARQGLVVRDEHAFGQDYARTLACWREAFDRNWEHIARLGFDERFRRMWRMYYCYCEAGFRVGSIDVAQFELAHA